MVLKKSTVFIVICFLKSQCSTAQTPDSLKGNNWTTHFQLTVIAQSHPGFRSLYSGNNSLADSVENGATSVTSTLFVGRKLWKGSAFYFNPELSGGRGLSYAVGVAGAVNGETYRIGDAQPVVSVARVYLQQNIILNNSSYEDVDDGQNQLRGKIPANRIAISAGKFSISDFFDKNSVSHDPRSQFMNWSLMSNGAWDYPANTKGYTLGLVVELIKPKWTLRFSSVAVPKIANHPELEYSFGKAHSETAEFEHAINIHKRSGRIRFLLSYSASRAPSYNTGLLALNTSNTSLLNVISGNAEGKAYGGKKAGAYLNIEQEITNDISAFARIGWNDGKYATWAFTEIDQTLHAGLSLKGSRWKRKDDVIGIAAVINGISAEHRNFLKAGGYGFIIGDGNLNYAHEAILETYYNAKLFSAFWLTLDYQFVNHPAYNEDRGPVHVFSVRGHIEF